MANGPPSSNDIGGVYGGGTASSSWEQSLAGYGYGGVDPATFFAPTLTRTDKVIALVRLGVAFGSIVLGLYAILCFYRSRWILDIRTRSAYLVMFGGGCVVLTMVVAINSAARDVWGAGFGWFWTSLLLFSLLPALLGSYISRALRLAVVFHPRAKRALPWLVPERNHLAVLSIVSVAMLAIPIYDEYTLNSWETIPRQTDILVWISVAFAVVLASIYPFIRKVDDLFNISTELMIVTAIIILLAFVQWAVREWGGTIEDRYVGDNIFILASLALFGVSVVDPLRRLALDPLAATKRSHADRILLSRIVSRSTVRTASELSSGIGVDSEDESRLEEETVPPPPLHCDSSEGNPDVSQAASCLAATPVEGGDVSAVVEPRDGTIEGVAPAALASTAPLSSSRGGRSTRRSGIGNGGRRTAVRNGGEGRSGGRGGSGGGGGGRRRGRGGGSRGEATEVWDFERLARTPLLAAAFEDFSRKALCHESVLFLGEVSRYQDIDYVAFTGTPHSAATAAASPPTQFGKFSYIVNTFIKAGSVEEVNISDEDKKRIIDLYHKGQAVFEQVGDEERRMVFRRAYVEVRQMLEENLLRRFLQTDQFKSVRIQRANVQAMMDSPQQAAEEV